MIKRLSLYTLLLLLVPFFVWIFHWYWQGNVDLGQGDSLLCWLTETGSMPYAVLTSAFFVFLLMWLVQDKRYFKLVFVTCVLAVIMTQGVKEGLKMVYKEPRPFATYVAEQTQSTTDAFYSLPRKERSLIVKQFFAEKNNVPKLIRAHYEHETGYSFPSGHSIFAATWLMLFVGFTYLLRRQVRTITPAVTVIISFWALLMLISRLRLGMHYPIDLFVAVGIAGILHIGIFSWIRKYFHLS